MKFTYQNNTRRQKVAARNELDHDSRLIIRNYYSRMLGKIKSLGCRNDMKIMLAYQSYLELIAIEHVSDVTCIYNSNLDLMYLRVIKNDIPSVYVPIHSSSAIRVSWMQDVLEQLPSDEPKNVILVIRESDSSSVQYRITDGLFPANLLANRSMKKSSSQKKRKLNTLEKPSTSKEIS